MTHSSLSNDLQKHIVATYHVNLVGTNKHTEFIAIVDQGEKGYGVYEVNRNGTIKTPHSPLSLHSDIDINFDGEAEGTNLYLDDHGSLAARVVSVKPGFSEAMPQTVAFGPDTIPTDCGCGYDLNNDDIKDHVSTQRLETSESPGGDYTLFETQITITPTWTPLHEALKRS